MSTFSVRLGEYVEAYLTLRRTLGYSLVKQAAILRKLVGYVEAEQHEDPLSSQTVLAFVLSRAATANSRATTPPWPVIAHSSANTPTAANSISRVTVMVRPLPEADDPRYLADQPGRYATRYPNRPG